MLKQSKVMAPSAVRTILLATVLGTMACGSDQPLAPRKGAAADLAAAAGDTAAFYMYEHQPIALAVDPQHVIVLSTDVSVRDTQSVRQLAKSLVSSLGVQIDSVAPLGPPPFHWLLTLSAGTAAPASSVARTQLAASPSFRTVLPVYRTRDGNLPVFVLNRVIARFKAGVSRSQVDNAVAALGAVVVRPPVPDSGYVTYLIEPARGSTADVLHLANSLDASSLAEWASPDMIRPATRPMSVPSDAFFPLQYYLHNTISLNGVPVDIDAERAWDLTKGSSAIRVIFIDTGVDQSHAEWSARGSSMIGFDALWYRPEVQPGEWAGHPACCVTEDEHGTAAAGIVLAAHDGIGTAGIAPNVLFDAVRIFRGNNIVATDNDIANGITWAAAHGDVLNNSWGGCGSASQPIRDAVVNAMSTGRGGKGAVVVFSAGNYNPGTNCFTTQTWESQIPGVISVAALSRTGARASYSLTGSAISVSAFGGEIAVGCFNADIVTTILSYNTSCFDGPSGNYKYTSGFGGTSAAAPQVSGVAALLLSREPNLTASQVKTRILISADPWGDVTQFGAGKLNAFKALANVGASATGPGYIDTPGSYIWTAHPTGGNGSYTYQWQESYNRGTSWINVGSNSVRYTENENSNNTFYLRVQVTSLGLVATSSPLPVTVQLSGCNPLC